MLLQVIWESVTPLCIKYSFFSDFKVFTIEMNSHSCKNSYLNIVMRLFLSYQISVPFHYRSFQQDLHIVSAEEKE